MSDIHESDTIFVSDLDEVKYHNNALENATFYHVSSTSGSQGCISHQ